MDKKSYPSYKKDCDQWAQCTNPEKIPSWTFPKTVITIKNHKKLTWTQNKETEYSTEYKMRKYEYLPDKS